MKKIICLVTILVVIVVLQGNNYYVVPEEAIRFRIVSNSNSTKDILMKQNVEYEINDVMEEIQTNNIDETRKNIINNIEEIESRIDNLFEVNNYDMPYDINYGINHFPEKIYKGVKYEEGEYESLVVEIGDAKGDNFWCVLYPPLCMIEESTDEVEYKFKIVEIFKKFF